MIRSPLIRGTAAGLTPLLAWLALPGSFSWWPVLLVCLIPHLLLLGRTVSLKKAFGLGLLSGLLFYLMQIYWIIPVLMQYGGLPWFFAAPALLLLVFYMSLYFALFSVGTRILLDGKRLFPLLAGAPALWVGLDWLRSWLFSGFPWMDIGYGFSPVPQLLQAADLFGHYGYTYLIVLVNCLIAAIAAGWASRLALRAGVAAVSLLVLVLGGYSIFRWHQVSGLIDEAPAPVIGIVQGNVEQGRKWSPAERERTVENYIELSKKLGEEQHPALIVWPETALPFYPRNNELQMPLRVFVQTSRVALLTGTPWYEIVQTRSSRLIYYYNAAGLMSADGRFAAFYYKNHLVPYGEYVPLQRYMPFLAPLVEAVGDFSAGTIDAPLITGEIKAGVLICFESIFASLARAWIENEANVLVNLTNDAWYGKSSAPHQSWAMTIYRAVETRRSLVRSANTGISGVVDPLGRVLVESELFVRWASARPVPLLNGQTVFVRGGWLFAPLCLAGSLIFLLGGAKRTQRRTGSVL